MANMKRTIGLGAVVTSVALVLSACSTDATPSETETTGNEPVTLTWWHNATVNENGENTLGDLWDEVASEFMAANPHVTIEIEQVQNNDLQRTRIPVALQSGDAPDLFQQWGGGELAQQVDAGYLMDLTSVLASDITRLGGSVGPWQYDGKTYGLPYTFGVEGFWYRKSLFEQAGIEGEPSTIAELNDAVAKLKAAGIEPIAVGAVDGWPAGHWWYNFALRACSKEAILAAGVEKDFSDPCFIDAGTQLEEFIATEPFQANYTSAKAQEGATSSAGLVATGNAAMELMGHWNIFVFEGFAADDAAKAALQADLGWFPFPATATGEGAGTAALGGGDGFSCYIDAPAECADLLSYISSDDVQKRFASVVGGQPVAPAAASSVEKEILQEIAAAASQAEYVQLWLDVAFGSNVGTALNDAVVQQFSKVGTPQDVVDAMVAAAATE